MKALILVDIQNDFLPGGPLGVPDGDAVISVANNLTGNFDLVVATQDWHPADHLGFAAQHAEHNVGDVIELSGVQQILWPDHCVQDSRGAAFADALDTSQLARVVRKGIHKHIDSYSGFFENDHKHTTELDAFLKSRDVTAVYVMGLATDYCVLFTALDAIDLGYETWLIEDGCRGIDLNPGDIDRAIAKMQEAGVHLTSSKSLKGSPLSDNLAAS